MSEERLVFNGIDGSSGDYLLPPLSAEEVSRLARGEALDQQHLKELQWKHQWSTQATLGPAEGIDPKDLAQTGWGVIFAHDADPAVREALGELLAHRKAQAGARKEHYYREFGGPDGYRPGESKRALPGPPRGRPGPRRPASRCPTTCCWSASRRRSPAPSSTSSTCSTPSGACTSPPSRSTPATPAASSPRSAGRRARRLAWPRRAAFFGAQNPDDRATRLSATELVAPLAEALPAQRYPGWAVETALGAEATKARLGALLGGADTPALLFTASHGMGFPNGDPRQGPHQGALLCQDWPGPRSGARRHPRTFYLAADDVPDGARLLGLIAFHFACYGAGTPRLDDFAHQAFRRAGRRRSGGDRPPRLRRPPPAAPAGAPRAGGPWPWSGTSSAPGATPSSGARPGASWGTFESALLAPGGGAPRRLGDGVLQRALRRAVHVAERGAGGHQVRQGPGRPGAGRAVDGQQRRPQLRRPRRPGGAPPPGARESRRPGGEGGVWPAGDRAGDARGAAGRAGRGGGAGAAGASAAPEGPAEGLDERLRRLSALFEELQAAHAQQGARLQEAAQALARLLAPAPGKD